MGEVVGADEGRCMRASPLISLAWTNPRRSCQAHGLWMCRSMPVLPCWVCQPWAILKLAYAQESGAEE
jgi:hypothetical protein